MSKPYLAILLSSAALAQAPAPTTFTPEMCKVKQPAPVSAGYIHYCMDVSENKVPSCINTTPPPPSTKPGVAPKVVYFEPLDCAWHDGKNPRIKVMPK